MTGSSLLFVQSFVSWSLRFSPPTNLISIPADLAYLQPISQREVLADGANNRRAFFLGHDETVVLLATPNDLIMQPGEILDIVCGNDEAVLKSKSDLDQICSA